MAPLARSWVLRCLLIVAAIETVGAQEVDDYMRDWMQKQHVPAVALAVIKDGTLIKAEGFGLSDVENHISARPDTVFKIGSLSKQFLAAGIMLLVQDGRVTVDDKVGKFLAETPAPWAAITLRHLLTHTSGLVRESPGFDFNKRQSDLDVVRAAYSVPLASVPGEKYEYSNLGYFALAEVITQVSGKPWADFLNERIFVPLGMTATRVTSLADIIPNRAHGYAWSSGQLQNEDDWPAIRPSGAFVSTILDLAKWDRSLSGEQILKDASKREMWQSVRLNNGRTFPYGFGWQLDDWPADAPTPTGVPMMRHGGAINGFRAGYARWPRQRLTVIVLTNLTNAPYEGLVANVAIRYVPELKTQPAR